ncbi:MAG: hypothetical protein KDE51_10465, partial [Anaerolineales bacterium]|nr:hypothetical protein [Anaerolineales bacterium]
MFKKLISKIVGDPNKKVIKELQPLIDEVAHFEAELTNLTDDQLRERTAALRERVSAVTEQAADHEEVEAFNMVEDALEDVLPEAYALVREASRRTTGLRHYDVQIMGGILLNRAHIVEMRTGEGKTLVATLPLFLNALSGK